LRWCKSGGVSECHDHGRKMLIALVGILVGALLIWRLGRF